MLVEGRTPIICDFSALTFSEDKFVLNACHVHLTLPIPTTFTDSL